MKCLECNVKTSVIESRPHANGVQYRTRNCPKCHKNFRTKEILTDEAMPPWIKPADSRKRYEYRKAYWEKNPEKRKEYNFRRKLRRIALQEFQETGKPYEQVLRELGYYDNKK